MLPDRTRRAARFLALLIVPLSAAPALAQDAAPSNAPGRAFAPGDWYRLATLSSPAVSPDGRQVAVTVTTVLEEENRRLSEIWLVGVEGGDPVRLTAPGISSSNPRWSPDGSLLLFTSRRPGASGTTWALRMSGGPAGEAFQPEHWPEGPSPADGSFVISAAPVDPEDSGAAGDPESPATGWEGMAEMARPPFSAVTRPAAPDRFDGMHITDLPYKANGRGFVPSPSRARRSNPQQLWRQAAGDSARDRITDASYSHRNPAVSPDGRWIAFTADPELRPDSVVAAERDSLALLPWDPERDEIARNEADLFLLPVEGGTPRRLTLQTGSEGSLRWAPDSRRIAFRSSLTRTSSSRIWLVDIESGGEARNLLGDWQWEPEGMEWIDDRRILFHASVGGRTAVFQLDVADGEIREVVSGRRRITGISVDKARTVMAWVATSIDRPTELFVSDPDGGNERRITGFNDALNEEIAWPAAERFTYESVGGLEIEGWLQYPHGYDPSRRYPLVLYIHGGPHSAYGEGWFDEFHNLTGAGMFVLFTNPRGSSGYGADFTYSTRGRWGMEDYEDLMKAVDLALERPDVDPDRIGVTGGSYGGFMTAWITTRTQRFRAAQTDRMISNWVSWYGSSEAQGLTEWEFYGKPWENPALYAELSPIHYVGKVRTPTLIVQSEEDHRTPMTDAEQWFMALRKQGVPAEFLRYPRSNHDLSRTGEPWLLVDRLARIRQWFEHWLAEDGTR